MPQYTKLASLARTLSFTVRNPVAAIRQLNHSRIVHDDLISPASLLRHPSEANTQRGSRLLHVGAFVEGNAGDVLLPIVLRDLFDKVSHSDLSWRLNHAHPLFESANVKKANTSKGVVIGGGGLFLRDTNSNDNSGWQWNCSVKNLEQIEVPIAVFAVGYNRFRGQEDFAPIFKEHLHVLAEKSVYIGLRNQGSIRAVREYLPPNLRTKVRFQPCMTTLISNIYPDLLPPSSDDTFRIAVNAAFDRPEMRFPEDEIGVLRRICEGIKRGGEDAEIDFVSHCIEDTQILPFAREAGISHRHVSLLGASAAEIIRYYASVDLVIGMRGHAQMIPFGCGTPIISLISHDKLRWFLDDIDRTSWGVEVSSSDVSSQLTSLIHDVRADPLSFKEDIAGIQSDLWQTSRRNVLEAITAFGISSE